MCILIKSSFASVIIMFVILLLVEKVKLIYVQFRAAFLFAQKDPEVWWWCVWYSGCWSNPLNMTSDIFKFDKCCLQQDLMTIGFWPSVNNHRSLHVSVGAKMTHL